MNLEVRQNHEITRRRRKSSFAALLYKSITMDTSQLESETKPSSRDEIIKKFISSQQKEIENWRKKTQKIAFEHNSKKRLINAPLTWNDCKDYLTAEDMEFLKGRTSCEELIREVKRVNEKIEITNYRMDKIDSRINATTKKKRALVFKMKKDVCNYLLNCDESNDLLEFDDDMSS